MTKDNSQNMPNNIENAVEIVERFGGIRPMATKMGVAVTTIQGWKQRDSIPAGRRDDLLKAAQEHGVDLSDLLGDGDVAGTSSGSSSAASVDISLNKPHKKPAEQRILIDRMAQTSGDFSVAPEAKIQDQSTTMAIAGVLILAAAVIGVVFAIAPKVNKLTDQDKRIKQLEAQVQTMKQEQAQPQTAIALPAEYQKSLAQLQNKVGKLAAEAQNYKGVVSDLQRDLQNGTMQQRMAQIEGKVQTLVAQARSVGLDDMITKIKLMQASPEGAEQLSALVTSLLPTVQTSEGAEGSNLTTALEQLKSTDPKVAAAFKDVAPEDMKAAVMLVGMAQLRSSLARDNQSFDSDLALLKATMAKNDPQLAEAIDRLAPKSKSGVLTPDGLSSEFRGLAGEVVEASLTGKDVSIEDKALARFGKLVKVEKDGEQVSGTPTQIKVAEAQKLLDQGDIEGAVKLLQDIQGPAAEKTKPFIDQAQATLMAQKVQQMLSVNLMSHLQSLKTMRGGGRSSGGAYMVNGGSGLDDVMAPFKSLVPELQKGGMQ